GIARLEAQASGLPVVVSDMGGPQELMVDGVTGFKVSGRDVAGLHRAMVELMDRETRERMGRAAREFVESNRVDEPFTAILDSQAYRRRARLIKSVSLGEELDATADFLDVVNHRFATDESDLSAAADG